jgi:hypothetical protein
MNSALSQGLRRPFFLLTATAPDVFSDV